MRRYANESVADGGQVAPALVIGYGNDLRTDDGAGRWVAEQIEEMGLEGVEVRSAAQLTPELALAIAGRDVVVFVDASIDVDELTVESVDASGSASDVMTHHGNPATLLSMVPNVGAMAGAAWLVSIPANDLSMGLSMTPRTQAAAEGAVARITDLVS